MYILLWFIILLILFELHIILFHKSFLNTHLNNKRWTIFLYKTHFIIVKKSVQKQVQHWQCWLALSVESVPEMGWDLLLEKLNCQTIGKWLTKQYERYNCFKNNSIVNLNKIQNVLSIKSSFLPLPSGRKDSKCRSSWSKSGQIF